MKIEDGTGSGRAVAVNAVNRLDVSSRSSSREFYVSRDDGQAYSFTSAFTADTGEEIISIKNTSATKPLFIWRVTLSAANAAVFTTFQVTSGTSGGTPITAANLNLTSANAAEATSYGDAQVTGSLSGTRLLLSRVGAGDEKIINTDGAIILGQNDEIAITYTGSTGLVECTVEGFYSVD